MNAIDQLDKHLDKWRERSFSWGEANCCIFAADWLRTVKGASPMHGLDYTHDEGEARKLIYAVGESLGDAVAKRIGCDEVLTTFAQIGDVVLLPLGQHGVVGICCGRLTAVLADGIGIAYVPTSKATRAWRVEPT